MLAKLMEKARKVDLSLPCKTPKLQCADARRFHITCFFCRRRRQLIGELPKVIKVQINYYTLRLDPPRRFARIKDIIAAKVVEWAAA